MTSKARKEYLKKRLKMRKVRIAQRQKKRAIKEWCKQKRLKGKFIK